MPRLWLSLREGSDAGAVASPEQPLRLRGAEQRALSLDEHAKLTLVGPAHARLLPERERASLLAEGLLAVQVHAAAERSTRAALWLGTPAGRLDVSEAATFALRVFADGSVRVATIAGHLTLRAAGVEMSLGAGETLCVRPGRPPQREPALRKLELARASLAASKRCAGKTSLAGAVRDLTEALARYEALREHERALSQAHVRFPEAERATQGELRAELAQMAARALSARAQIRALRAQLEAAALGELLDDSTQPLLGRARRLVPYAE